MRLDGIGCQGGRGRLATRRDTSARLERATSREKARRRARATKCDAAARGRLNGRGLQGGQGG